MRVSSGTGSHLCLIPVKSIRELAPRLIYGHGWFAKDGEQSVASFDQRRRKGGPE